MRTKARALISIRKVKKVECLLPGKGDKGQAIKEVWVALRSCCILSVLVFFFCFVFFFFLFKDNHPTSRAVEI